MNLNPSTINISEAIVSRTKSAFNQEGMESFEELVVSEATVVGLNEAIEAVTVTVVDVVAVTVPVAVG